MKILAVRGQNLASLEDRFALPLDQGALGRAGLFAITGPTGAGKSTLLDAICLCLYNSTPRLARSGGAAVRLPGDSDDTALGANDQRNVLRRGAAEGWAEVDFSDRQGRRWTARWEVRRARRKADGKVQQEVLTLRDAAGQAHGGTKTETLAAIRDLIGLDFEQFRRSVLLAQGDFAAFLRANENERANLLEAMTGTEIYTRLSQAAFGRRRDWERRLAELRTRLDEQGVLTAEQRAAAEAALATAVAARTQAAAGVARAEQGLRWHADHQRLRAGVEQAAADHERARTAWDEAATRREAFSRAQQGWDLRGLARGARTAALQADQASQQAQAARRALTRAGEARDQANAALERARAALAHACRDRLEQVERRLAAAREGLSDEQRWLDQHPGHQRLADDAWQRDLAARLDRRGARQAEVQRLERSLETLGQQAQARQGAVERAAAASAAADRAATDAAAAAAAAGQRAATHDEEALTRDRRALDAQQAALAEVQRIAARAALLAEASDTALAERDEAAARAARAEADLSQVHAQLDLLGPRLDEARAALARAQAAVDAAGLRATLQPEQPCPVCGSLDHPWAEGSPLAALHQELHERVGTLERQARDAAARLAALEATAGAASAAAQAAAVRARQAQAGAEALAAPWSGPARELGLGDTPPSLAGERIESLGAALAARAAELATREQAAREARRALEQARAGLQLAQQAARRAADAAAEGQRQLDQAQAEQQRAADGRDAAERALQDLHAELALVLDPLVAEVPGLDGWRALLDQPAGLLARCTDAGQQWAQHRKRREQAQAVVDELHRRQPLDRDAAERAVGRARAEELALEAPEQPPAELRNGPLTEWHDQQVERASAALARAEAEAEQASQDWRQQDTASQVAEATHAGALQRREAAQAELEAARLERGIDAEQVAALLLLPEGWLEAEGAALDLLRQAPRQSETVLTERRRLLAAHEATPTELDAAAATSALQAAQAALAAADEAWGEARGRLKADDEAQARLSQLQGELEHTRRAAEPWLQLADCIGQGGGQVFRRFAQSLTLELLLDQANHHLRQLHPRYSLARIDGTDLDVLVIDHDLGDEPRTVQSLSGGEAFLASLALALGLSSLSSRDVRVESLFIDEGFGTLDARTLDTALAVLDSLQASGRQVGVISHVGGLAERIGVQVQVEPQGGGRSVVRVVEG